MSASVGPMRLDDNRQRLDSCLERRQEEIAEPAHALAERHRTAVGTEGAPVRGPNHQQPILHDPEAVDGLHAVLHPSREIGGNTQTPAARVEVAKNRPRIATALERDVDRELLCEGVHFRQTWRVGGRHDQRHVHRLGELEDLASRGLVRTEIVDTVSENLLVELAQAVGDRVPLARLEPMVHRFWHLERWRSASSAPRRSSR